MLGSRFACVVGLTTLLCSGTARAAEPDPEARRLYAQGKAEYAQGHYVEAIALFERSYALSESTALLFNMAQAHRLAGPAHCADALALYKSYVAAEPGAENRKEVEERIAELGECASQKSVESPAPAPAPAPAPVKDDANAAPRREPKALPRSSPCVGSIRVRAWDRSR